MVKNLKLMPDYECFALWDIDSTDNINPASLPISEDLKKRIEKWQDVYDATLNEVDPTSSGFESPDAEQAFDIEGRAIWEELKNELGRSYNIQHFSVIENDVIK
ncbi:hypothetical protein [Microbulbifer thermotolerans]|uniref:Uncharacterized protein n=1 Tax=Microbulbifer thermotolerans TaxID=252514 RepID=A0A143HMV2_MICTH|nr:hypothetical protein [Microbulbifer thermotolerans]AMX02837.1 hypothetical protein A3224_09815 [Microbulbifer thermotolerans]MCX2781348.1 hypothetical protein [Microbulbifer thermotolerans]MCX2804870.1 hypothetical protein [Microbulbifer thermotolerans]MCX2836480.1 hypothetical protein [Microbulbifer thermotolerans]